MPTRNERGLFEYEGMILVRTFKRLWIYPGSQPVRVDVLYGGSCGMGCDINTALFSEKFIGK